MRPITPGTLFSRGLWLGTIRPQANCYPALNHSEELAVKLNNRYDSHCMRVLALFALIATTQLSFADRAVAQDQPAAADGEAIENPFARRISIPDFPQGMEWLNTSKPLTK